MSKFLQRWRFAIVIPLIAILAAVGLAATGASTSAAASAPAAVKTTDSFTSTRAAFGMNHYNDFDYSTWYLFRQGSWWFVDSHWCFTDAWQDVAWIEIYNGGNAAHSFYWRYQNYYGYVYQERGLPWTIPAHTTSSLQLMGASSTGVGPFSQTNHPRVLIQWENSAGDWVTLNDHTPWTNPSNNRLAGMTYDHYQNQCSSWE